MTWISHSITAVGLILLGHACYSAHEHAALYSSKGASASAQHLDSSSSSSSIGGGGGSSSSPSVPADVAIETVIATVVVCLGLILGAANFRPIQWRVWAGKIEREGEAGFQTGSGEVEKDYLGNPFRVLESRPGFVDIRKQRREFTEWVKNDGKAATATG